MARPLSQTPGAIAARKRRAKVRAEEWRNAANRWRAHLNAHQVTYPHGLVVAPGDYLFNSREEPYTLVSISRAPGDGSATNGKIIVKRIHLGDTPDGREEEYYPSVFGVEVTRIPGAKSPFDVEA